MKIRNLLPLLIFLNCWGYDRKLEEKQKMDSLKLGFLISWYNIFAAPKAVFILKDYKNGVVGYTREEYSQSYDLFFLKKCLQGQVYRPEQNDCRGTGDINNNYGATLLQFCDKNDGSCSSQKSILDGSGNSESFKSCNGETLNNSGLFKKVQWDIIDATRKKMLADVNKDIFSDIPRMLAFWINNVNNSYQAEYTSFDTINSGLLSYDQPTNGKYIICYHQNTY